MQERSSSESAKVEQSFDFFALPYELKRNILELAVDHADSRPVALLCSCREIYAIVLPLLYVDIQISSIEQAHRFLDKRSAVARHCPSYTKSYTFTLIGVPGGSTRGGRDSAPASPGGSRQSHSQRGFTNDRLWLASHTALRCTQLQHLTYEMFGVRHSTLLTSSEFLNEVAMSFQAVFSQLRQLKTFAWITPRVNHNFVGFSVAVVDLSLPPMIEGLQAAAIDMTADGKRAAHAKGSVQRRAHSLERVTLHHCIFPLRAYVNESFFYLFAQTHPDDDEWLLFPSLRQIVVRTAINVDPQSVAFLALTWQLRLDPHVGTMLTNVEQFQLLQNVKWDPQIHLCNAFVGSIWGPRVKADDVRQHIVEFIDESRRRSHQTETSQDTHIADANAVASPLSNAFIRVLEECTEAHFRLSNTLNTRLAKLESWQVDELIDRACQRVHIESSSDAIAGIQEDATV